MSTFFGELQSLGFGYDSAGLINSLTYGSLTSSYQTDDKYQITTSTSSQGNEGFTYDDLGNRTSDNSGSYIYDTKKLLLQEDFQYLYSYDYNGNLTSKQERGLTELT